MAKQKKDGDKVWDANMILDDGGDLTEMVHKDFPELLNDIHGISVFPLRGTEWLRKSC